MHLIPPGTDEAGRVVEEKRAETHEEEESGGDRFHNRRAGDEE